jgi:hypothetical protein
MARRATTLTDRAVRHADRPTLADTETVCNLPASGRRSASYLVADIGLSMNGYGHKKLSKLNDIASFSDFLTGNLL